MYKYKAKVTRVIDGDTVDCEVDLGFYMVARIRFRLGSIDSEELRSSDAEERERAKAAKQFLIDLVEGKEVIVMSNKTGKYGRWIGYFYFEDGGECINNIMVENNHAIYKNY